MRAEGDGRNRLLAAQGAICRDCHTAENLVTGIGEPVGVACQGHVVYKGRSFIYPGPGLFRSPFTRIMQSSIIYSWADLRT